MVVCMWLLLSAGCSSLVLIFCAAKDSHDAAFGMGRHYDSHPLPVGSEDDEDTLDDAAFGAAGMPLVKQLVPSVTQLDVLLAQASAVGV